MFSIEVIDNRMGRGCRLYSPYLQVAPGEGCF